MISILRRWCYLLSFQKVCFNIHKMCPGDYILVRAEDIHKMYLITQGAVKFSKIFTDTSTLTLAILRENDLITIIKTQNYYYYSAEALSFTLILSYNYDKILQKSNQFSTLHSELVLAYHRYIQKVYKIIQVLSHRDKINRLINLLLILCQQFGIVTRFGIVINLVMTHNTLAIIIGSSRITITKILNSFQKTQVISVYHNKLLIHDPISLSLFKYL
uniref:Global nitrogen transcriptional regulator n=1 Tax=Apophlaea sinclairii TaxID=212746 RepID=A0A1C9CBS1_9FLOR|nr:global nitrogen transcriptional regulator [Apophlaea sinclairii]AOM65826.1 global nitrogen transcriptional regulator [Apophlaea sinclairii]